ncbi:MAG: IdeS/Mac family cysteine endopeptidase [Treponema sp.]
MKNKLFIYAVFAAILFAACKNDPESENPPAPETVHVQDISIKNPINPVSLVKGTTYQLEAAVLPENADNKKISYTSSNKTVISVSANGLISAENIGTTTITLKAENISKTINVTVTPTHINVASIAVASIDENVSIVKGGTHQLSATVKPENATNKTLTYSSDREDIASVDTNGLISAKKVGTASVTIHAADGITKTISVTVTSAHVSATGIAVASGDENVPIVKGGTHQLSATVKPENATNKTLTYSSDREDIASVDTNGLITAKKVGTASVTIHAADGITKTISVTVTEAEVPVTDIEFAPPLPAGTLELTIGQVYKFGAKAMPDNATNKNLKFTTSDSSTAWLCGDGNSSVKGEKEGTATVTIESESNPGVKKIVNLKIKPKPSIKIKTNPEMCESGGGNVSFTMETFNGKLGYTPEVTGGGAKWLNIAGKDSTDETTDTVRLSVSENKTVWERTAYIKFKDNSTNQYIKASDKKDLEVKLSQKKNEHPNVETRWVHGVEKPENGEKVPVLDESGNPMKDNGQTVYYNSNYVTVWKENENTKFFNVRKLHFVMRDTMAPYCYNSSDSNMCWAMTASNMLHWWVEQNKDLVNKYNPDYNFLYTKGLEDNEEYKKSKIAAVFRSNCINKGNEIRNGLEGFLFSSGDVPFKKIANPKYFDKVFSKTNNIVTVETLYSKQEFEDIIKNALASKKAIGLDISDGKNLHAITLWGAAFDGDENIIAIYVVDNNNPNNEMFTYGIRYQKNIYADAEENYPYLINYAVKKSAIYINKYIDRITTLDKGEEQWKKWRDANP